VTGTDLGRFGLDGIELNRLVLGCAPLAGLFAPVSPDTAAGALEAAWDEGIRAFDTAPHYGAGLSEERLGAFFAGKPRDQFIVSTKVGRLLVPTPDDVEGDEDFFGASQRARVRDYSGSGVQRSIEESCERMGLDRVDVALVHDPDNFGDVAFAEAYPALRELREAGAVSAIGAGMNRVEMLERFVLETDVDCVLSAGRYSLLEPTAAERLLPACAKRGVAALVAGVLGTGILVDPRPGVTHEYRPARPETLARAQRIRAVCDSYGAALPSVAMHYVLAHPAVTAIVVGARSEREVRENAAHYRSPVPAGLFEELVAEDLMAPPGNGTAGNGMTGA
jgi:D-threo-aldose 1-dehydrogenase